MFNLQDRTNHAEATNRRLHTELRMKQPTIWSFITGLQKVQRKRDAFFEQLIGSHPPPFKSKVYMKADETIFSQLSRSEYFRGIAYNFQ